MAKILVAGGFSQEPLKNPLEEACEPFVAALGGAIIKRGHILLGGCRTRLDAIIANAAKSVAVERQLDPRKVIRSWVTKTTEPAHSVGAIIHSGLHDWGHVPRGLIFPEPFQEADVVIIVGGFDGTHYAATWARLANKPIIPVAAFGFAAAEIFDDEVSSFDRRYASRLALDEFQILNQVLPDLHPQMIESFATEVVTLAERLITPTDVFVIMSFAEKGHLKDAFNTMYRVCAENGFKAYTTAQQHDPKQRIIPAILDGIRRSAFVIADVSDPRPNVYYELGFAQALGKDVITCANEGTTLHFDIFDVPTLFWDSQDMLERKLQVEVSRIAQKFGRQMQKSASA